MHGICTKPAQVLHKTVQGIAQDFAHGIAKNPCWIRVPGVIRCIAIYYIVIYRIKTLHT